MSLKTDRKVESICGKSKSTNNISRRFDKYGVVIDPTVPNNDGVLETLLITEQLGRGSKGIGARLLIVDTNGRLPQYGVGDIDRLIRRGIGLSFHSYDFSITGGPKDELADKVARYCQDVLGASVLAVLNPGKVTRDDTYGSYVDGLYTYSGLQIIELVASDRIKDGKTLPYVSMDPIHPDFKEGPQRIRIHLNLSEYITSKHTEEIVNGLLKGDALLYRTKEATRARSYLKSRGIDATSKVVAVTNPDEFMPNFGSIYSFADLHQLPLDNTIIFTPAGTFLRVAELIGQVPPTYDAQGNRSGPIIVPVTSPGNSAAVNLHWGRNRGNVRTDDGNFSYNNGEPILTESQKRVIWYASNGDRDIRLMVADDIDKRDGMGIVGMLRDNSAEYGGFRISSTGCEAVSALSARNCITNSSNPEFSEKIGLTPEEKAVLREDGIIFRYLYSYKIDERGRPYLTRNPLTLGAGEKPHICIVTTGSSSIDALRRNISYQYGKRGSASVSR